MEYALRKKYRDPRKLKDSLDTLYGTGQYKVATGWHKGSSVAQG